MADDDDQGTSSGSRPKLLLPKAPGPAQPLSHAASRHRKKLDAALSAGGYYDVAHGRESSRAKRIQVIDLALHPGLTAPTGPLASELCAVAGLCSLCDRIDVWRLKPLTVVGSRVRGRSRDARPGVSSLLPVTCWVEH